jgi:voltage-gated potassium channel
MSIIGILDFHSLFLNNRKIVEPFIAVLTATSVLVILFQYVYPLNPSQMLPIYLFDFIVAVILALDFFFRMKSSKESRPRFLLKHCYEIPAMIPLFTFAVLENQNITGAGVRVLRLLRMYRVMQLSFRTLRIFEGTSYLYFAAFSIIAIVLAASAIYEVEPSAQGSTIRNLGDAFWWAVSTVTTVSYGDVYHVTIEGKVIAVVLMIVGLAILGVFISTVGAAIIEKRLRRPHSNLLSEETKTLIKYKINGIESLTLDDFEDLMLSTKNLREMGVRKQR